MQEFPGQLDAETGVGSGVPGVELELGVGQVEPVGVDHDATGNAREIVLAIQARNGMSAGALVWLVIVGVAALTAFVFLCVAGYEWLALMYGAVPAGLIMAGIFVVFAIIAAIVSALIRKRNRERAILARAAKAQTPSWLLDPRFLATAVQVGRELGWERLVPVALVGFLAAQWARQKRNKGEPGAPARIAGPVSFDQEPLGFLGHRTLCHSGGFRQAW